MRHVPVFAALLLVLGCAAGFSPAPHPTHEVLGSAGRTAGPLELSRVELSFAGGLGEATVSQGEQLAATALLRFDGNGQFRATWVVDGRVLGAVSFPVTFGSTVRLRTGAAVVLPTFEPGPHRVTLRVIEPALAFAVPSISYFVTGEKLRGKE